MSAQPKALFLADVIESDLKSAAHHDDAAAELRRLSAENESLRQIVQDFPPVEAELREVSDRAHRLEAQRDALLEALRTLLSYANVLEMRLLDADGEHRAMQQARAAIKAVEEGK